MAQDKMKLVSKSKDFELGASKGVANNTYIVNNYNFPNDNVENGTVAASIPVRSSNMNMDFLLTNIDKQYADHALVKAKALNSRTAS
jgi:hypothetical protein